MGISLKKNYLTGMEIATIVNEVCEPHMNEFAMNAEIAKYSLITKFCVNETDSFKIDGLTDLEIYEQLCVPFDDSEYGEMTGIDYIKLNIHGISIVEEIVDKQMSLENSLYGIKNAVVDAIEQTKGSVMDSFGSLADKLKEPEFEELLNKYKEK